MFVSIFDLFSIGIGPSSSHTVGPMRAAKRFIDLLKKRRVLNQLTGFHIDLYGSLAMTGKGHATDRAILLGLEGHTPEGVDPDKIEEYIQRISDEKSLLLMNSYYVPFDLGKELHFHKGKFLPFHSNAMKLTAYLKKGKIQETYYSIGGGFILSHEESRREKKQKTFASVPYPFSSAEKLLELCEEYNMRIDEIVLENEKALRDEEGIKEDLLHIWHVMQSSVLRGCQTPGILPGGLNVKRRAPEIYEKLMTNSKKCCEDPTIAMDWISLFALAVNEENAAGGRVVTAPTNGAAGIIPAVLHYFRNFVPSYNEEEVIRFLLTAAAICQLYKGNASISAAEVGCQGEVGVASSIAAAGLCAVLGGTPEQIEHAAEIGMEHHLGLTCDPIAGLVQIPCIERNTMGALHAINAARLALLDNGKHIVSLDQVIETMYATGRDMHHRYKETSEGGLAKFVKKKSKIPVSIPEC